MSINFHANQYEQAFTPTRIQNAEVPKCLKGKYPAPQTGFTRIKANDRGHLLPGVPKERSSPWGSYVGTWDMPTKIPGARILNPTARAEDAVLKGQVSKLMADDVINGHLKRCHTVDPLPVKMDMDMEDPLCGSTGPVDPHMARSPVGNVMSPKPVTPMAVADVNVQMDATRLVSPLAANNNNAVQGGLRTPDADLQNRAGAQPSPGDRIVGMKSPTDVPC